MYLRKRSTYLRSGLTLTAGSFAAQTLKLNIDRTWPLEEIIVVVNFTAKAVCATPVTYYMLNVLKRANLSINDGIQPRSIVDVTGPGLLFHAMNEGLNLDGATRATIADCMTKDADGSFLATAKHRIAYRIPLVHPAFTGSLRVRSLCPIHNFPQDPVLTLDFAAAAEMSGEADPFTAITVDVILVKREMPKAVNDAILGAGGYISSDLIESAFSVSAVTTQEQRFQVPSPGQYTGLSLMSINNSLVADIGVADSQWRIESAQVVLRDWKSWMLKLENEFSMALDSSWQLLTAGGGIPIGADQHTNNTAFVNTKRILAPNLIGGALDTGNKIQLPACVFLDFLTDGINDANELGSLLDCNLPANSGLKMEIIASSVTTTGTSSLNLVGRRLFGDLSRWQAITA